MKLDVLPNKLRLFALEANSMKPLPGVPMRLTLGLHSDNEGDLNVPIGILASDHVGYLAFELPNGSERAALYDSLQHVWLDLFLDENQRVDIIHHFGEHIAPPLTIPVLVETPVPRNTDHYLIPSTMNPDVTDWKISPGSFGTTDMPIIGEDGCETLLLSSVTERFFKFHQLTRSPQLRAKTLPHVEDYFGSELDEENHPPLIYREGKLLQYEMSWQPINHGLGQVLYSLTLAPCESVNIAVIDWSREDRAGRDEETGLTDRLIHDQRRDRVIEESVEATLQEWQSGESFMGGTAGTGGYGGGMMGQMWGASGSHSLGYSTASTAGNRTAEADTVQQVADRVAQASSLARNLRSTVIVQASQDERERLETRTVTNHNHCHALTVLYYEVVRHYCMQTRFVGDQDVLFIKYKLISFNRENIAKYRRILKDNLLENRFEDALNILPESLDDELEMLTLLKEGTVTKFLVRITMGRDGLGAPERLRLLILKANGTIPFLVFNQATSEHFAGDQPFFQSDPNSPTINTLVFEWDAETPEDPRSTDLKLTDIYEIGLTFDVQGDLGGQERFEFERMEVKAVVSYSTEDDEVTDTRNRTRVVNVLDASNIPFFMNDTEWWSVPNQLPDIDTQFETYLDRKKKIDALIAHLNDDNNKLHYNTLIWLNENPNERARRFENYVYTTDSDGDGAAETGRLIEFINNTPIGVFGDYVAFLTESFNAYTPQPDDRPTVNERIIAVPTRGAFAESKLSHCNACEEIDDTRYWDWQESPCGDQAPAITGIAPQSRRSAVGVDPTVLPAPGVGIETPAEAPAPVGLHEVMELLRTPDIFRDLSGLEELRPLLEKLVEVAGEVEKARIGKLDASYQPPGDENGGQGRTASGRTPQSTTTSTPRGQTQEQTGGSQSSSRNIMGQARAAESVVERARSDGVISDEEANSMRRQIAEGAVRRQNPPTEHSDVARANPPSNCDNVHDTVRMQILRDFPPRPIPEVHSEDIHVEYLNRMNAYRDVIYAYIRGRSGEIAAYEESVTPSDTQPGRPGSEIGIRDAHAAWERIPEETRQQLALLRDCEIDFGWEVNGIYNVNVVTVQQSLAIHLDNAVGIAHSQMIDGIGIAENLYRLQELLRSGEVYRYRPVTYLAYPSSVSVFPSSE